MAGSYGDLVPADETLNHQIVDTFASVAQSDPSWTEKVWCTAHARDGSLQVAFGLGKYTNRGVFDAAAGVSRGTEQWTVRASRRLAPEPERLSAGPVHYEVVEPLHTIHCVLEANEHAPIAFDVTMRGVCPASLEEPWPDRSPDGYRVSHDLLRYHQVGTAEGWVELNGERTEVTSESWFSVRDHSWGLRPGVGLPIPGLARGPRAQRMLMTWFPMLLERPDGSHYSLFAFFEHRAGDGFESTRSQAEEIAATGECHRFREVVPELVFDPSNRRATGGRVILVDHDGSTRPVDVSIVSDTGFHLGTAGYFGWNGRVLGQWAGELAVDGDHVAHCDRPDVARDVHQLRDVLVRVEDPVGGGTGVGNLETMVLGGFPDLGLSEDGSFL